MLDRLINTAIRNNRSTSNSTFFLRIYNQICVSERCYNNLNLKEFVKLHFIVLRSEGKPTLMETHGVE